MFRKIFTLFLSLIGFLSYSQNDNLLPNKLIYYYAEYESSASHSNPFPDNSLYEKIVFAQLCLNTNFWGIKGKVKSVKEKIDEELVQSIYNSEMYFNTNGQITFYSRSHGTDVGWETESLIYNQVNLIKSKEKILVDWLGDTYVSKYEYENGILISQTDSVICLNSLKGYCNKNFEYNIDGSFIQTTILDSFNSPSLFQCFEGKEFLIKDSLDNIVENNVKVVSFDSLGRIVFYLIDEGCGLEEKYCISAIIKYDSLGRLSSFSYQDMTILGYGYRQRPYASTINYKYNEIGHVIEMSSFINTSNTIYYFKYNYDSSSNWIKREMFENEKLINTVQRKIEYY